VTSTSERLAAFEAKWLARLEAGADAVFVAGPVPDTGGAPAAVADDWVAAHGLKRIGYNWEMLDPLARAGEPRSALGTLAEVFEHHMAFPQQEWLGSADARACASDFITAFDPARCTVLTNRMDFGWHPVSEAAIEWAFVGFDQERIALLLLTQN
jgi:hypothetical protein